jgi:phosphate transport system substrate-binding protein
MRAKLAYDAAIRAIERRAIGAAIALVLAAWISFGTVQAQPHVEKSASVKTIYVDVFEGKAGSADLRAGVIERLRSSGKVKLVNNPSEADLVVKGSGEIWRIGYQSNNLRSPLTSRQPVYTGYLSLELTDRAGQILWSYLVMPGGMQWRGADRDMADHIVRLMLQALAKGAPGNEPVPNLEGQVALSGAGSTFAAPLYQEWIESFASRDPHVHVNYRAVGSEEGIRLLEQGEDDFAGSDVPLTDTQMTGMTVKFTQFATVLGGVVPAYNVDGVGPDLRFTPEVLAGIYLGHITKWDDPRLRSLNHGVSLPNEPIVIFHRSDGSGTSFAWTQFLSRTSAEWKRDVGAGMRVQWPVGKSAAGNEGVAAGVAGTPGAIGYMELTYALRNELNFGEIRNQAGKFVQANLTTLSAAAKAARQSDLRVSLVNANGDDAYPVATFTWILVPSSVQDAGKRAALQQLIRWMLTSGQRECAALGYLPLPKEIAEDQLRRLDSTRASEAGYPAHTAPRLGALELP